MIFLFQYKFYVDLREIRDREKEKEEEERKRRREERTRTRERYCTSVMSKNDLQLHTSKIYFVVIFFIQLFRCMRLMVNDCGNFRFFETTIH